MSKTCAMPLLLTIILTWANTYLRALVTLRLSGTVYKTSSSKNKQKLIKRVQNLPATSTLLTTMLQSTVLLLPGAGSQNFRAWNPRQYKYLVSGSITGLYIVSCGKAYV